MADSTNTGKTATNSADEKKYFRSELSFPYADLESCVELAQTILSKAGTSCDQGELAAWMNQSASGGTFRTRISAAKMFGLIDTGQGRATLTQLGREAVDDSGNERAARVQAFLNPELFAKMYEQNKGHALPPPAAIERQMEQFGISPKQKERARQTFMKSATYAGFIDSSTGRFVKPGNVGGSREEASGAQERDQIAAGMAAANHQRSTQSFRGCFRAFQSRGTCGRRQSASYGWTCSLVASS